MKALIGIKDTITKHIPKICITIFRIISLNGTLPRAYPANAARGLKYPVVMLCAMVNMEKYTIPMTTGLASVRSFA